MVRLLLGTFGRDFPTFLSGKRKRKRSSCSTRTIFKFKPQCLCFSSLIISFHMFVYFSSLLYFCKSSIPVMWKTVQFLWFQQFYLSDQHCRTYEFGPGFLLPYHCSLHVVCLMIYLGLRASRFITKSIWLFIGQSLFLLFCRQPHLQPWGRKCQFLLLG